MRDKTKRTCNEAAAQHEPLDAVISILNSGLFDAMHNAACEMLESSERTASEQHTYGYHALQDSRPPDTSLRASPSPEAKCSVGHRTVWTVMLWHWKPSILAPQMAVGEGDVVSLH
ncbi:uncharacterized protein PV07_08617 [Cladophialophora immunda]|uniref:Uncharacterized protein n=1 Tax=Cladophialophora immunda TaxID=569365 RepID=A0A0D2CPF7_9EURO|nr:uncharacterized protein PV07_08617 [Cladophialophora immunda]KIW25444.1 hypothetical protein PV07_08617 [Cladophialophora immunda]OQV10134.1 hypothetical protein CLAIMM_14177 isoform 1 [Cladophialophora immunda]